MDKNGFLFSKVNIRIENIENNSSIIIINGVKKLLENFL
jgi:hypothetical protein